jgi:hypothetical protein
MGKYEAAEQLINAIFGGVSWKSKNIKTIPSNFPSEQHEHIKLSVIAGGEGINPVSANGVLIIDIFVTAGKSTKRAIQIADLLDDYLVGKVSSNSDGTLQLLKSALNHRGLDKDNPSLYRSQYTIPYNFYGVS